MIWRGQNDSMLSPWRRAVHSGTQSITPSRFSGQQKKRCQRPKSQEQSRQHPEIRPTLAVTGDDTAKNSIEYVHETRRAEQRRRFHLRFNKKKPGEITEEMIEIHEPLLTLPSRS
jgi:hypothetical protein